ncbi:hypothetical protein [Mesorhizobium sp. GbtcB19]|uniref:hypothetical protein n=1 Tax=Mesorhizobium sp. GbtcB19 TaxID=2824764 RepID=UPI001C300FC1|nr:hypothetical protein [Mesorhizobium sp. GbtcB19]
MSWKTIALKVPLYMTFAEKVAARLLSRVSKISGKPMSLRSSAGSESRMRSLR